VVKLGKLFSIFLVLTLLILLAPAVVLTGENVAQGQVCNNTQQIEANFSFNETSDGGWHDFIAGSAGIDVQGLYLEQYTRASRTRSTTLANCQYRNYTDGTGTASGLGLTGVAAMDVMWSTWKFGETYPYSPKYYSGSRFGTMMGRGHIDEGGGDNFTFIFILDYDSNNDMSAAGGKGFLLSIEENGRFANATGQQDVPENMHKVIGDFTITKTGTTYTGQFHLRNYDPSEVFDLGWLNVTGGVALEATDPIRIGLDILDFQTDGAQPTPITTQSTNFEEIGPGKDPTKLVTSGYMGTGGEMDSTRNTALYLELRPLDPPSGAVRIMGTASNNIVINDTDTGVRQGDGSKYGEVWELLLLFIPDQYLPVGDLFWQDGFTYTPFYLPNDGTVCYVGYEYFALAQIAIESELANPDQYSVDHSYGLYPHPKCEGTTPAFGSPGQNLTVTIEGKYFLRADGQKSGWVANSGDVNLGPGITVNSYTINTDDPVNNTITADISIAGGATPGPRVVNVTSCFGYNNTTGTPTGEAPYLSGNCSFTVALPNATLQGDVSFISRGTAPDARWSEPVTVRCFEPGNLNNEIWSQTATTDNNGTFTITNLTPGTYDIGIKNWTCLSELNTSVTLTNNSTTVVDFGTTREGDSNDSDAVTIIDFSLLAGAFGSTPAAGNWNPNCDFDRNGAVVILDFSLLAGNFGKAGPMQGY